MKYGVKSDHKICFGASLSHTNRFGALKKKPKEVWPPTRWPLPPGLTAVKDSTFCFLDAFPYSTRSVFLIRSESLPPVLVDYCSLKSHLEVKILTAALHKQYAMVKARTFWICFFRCPTWLNWYNLNGDNKKNLIHSKVIALLRGGLTIEWIKKKGDLVHAVSVTR